MVKSILISMSLLLASSLHAADKVPDIKRWIKTATPKVDSSKLVQKILFVKADGKVYSPWMPITQKDSLGLVQAQFISVINPNDITMCSKLNVEIAKEGSSFELSKEGPAALSDFFKCSKADTIIVGGPKVKRWTFYKAKDTKKIVKIYKTAGPKTLTPSAISRWLRKTLGYDAVVLAKEGPFILAGLTSEAKNKRLQGLLLKNTQRKFYVRGKEGAALLQLLKTYKGYGMFEVVIEKDDLSKIKYSKVLFNAK